MKRAHDRPKQGLQRREKRRACSDVDECTDVKRFECSGIFYSTSSVNVERVIGCIRLVSECAFLCAKVYILSANGQCEASTEIHSSRMAGSWHLYESRVKAEN